MSAEQKPGDPADKGLDTFQPTTNHRAGYGDDKLARLVAWLRDHPTTTLASGEGALLLGEIDRLRDDLHTQDGWVQWAKGEMDRMHAAAKDSMDHYTDARAEVDRLRDQLHLADQSARSSSAEAARLGRILAALRSPSEAVVEAVFAAMLRMDTKTKDIIRAAVAAAEQEVGRE